LTGTYRKDRHGPSSAAPAVAEWTLPDADLATFGPAGRAAILALSEAFTFSVGEAPLLREIGRVSDRLAELRCVIAALPDGPPRRAAEKVETANVRLPAALLAQLGCPKA
jgi:hypothetical protein